MDFNQQNFNELVKSIEHWNEYRVPILKISLPDSPKNLHFQGAMRFYFQDAGQKVATKCVNVTSGDTTKDVIDILIEKFRPDMRMLSVPEYGLYEIHENGDERKLTLNERPIFVQLEWNKDDLEGRFLLRRIDEKTRDLVQTNEMPEPSLKRKLSKKEKKKHEKLKKQQMKEQEKADVAANKLAQKNNRNGIAERLYNELPETSFTRSISNPEAVMKRRRAQKLEKRLQEFSLEGGQEAGGTLRIFGEAINKDVSYKTLLLSTKDTASSVVKQILEKYGKDREDPNNYCLIQLIVPPSATNLGNGDNSSLRDSNINGELRESILEDFECPLLINQNHDKYSGILTFHIRPKPADYNKRLRKKKPSRPQQGTTYPLVVQQLNQNFQLNNNQEQYSNQNSPQASSQTSGSMQHVDPPNHLPPPSPLESMHSAPNMYPMNNGSAMNRPPYQLHQQQQQQQQQQQLQQHRPMQPPAQRQHPNMAAFLTQPRNNANNLQQTNQNFNGSLPRTIHSQPNMGQQPNNNIQNGQFMHPGSYNPPQHQPFLANDQILPALIQVGEDVEDIFLNNVITHINPANIGYRLAPTYVLYMVSRYRASTLFHPELHAPSRAELFVPFTRKIATLIRNVIEMHHDDPVYLAFWLANSSDLCHFYKQDKHLTHFTIDAQKILSDSVRRSFNYWLNIKQMELNEVMNVFFDERDDQSFTSSPDLPCSVSPIINVLHQTMATMRKSHVNPALAIQIFSNLFLHISKWLFDRLIGCYDRQPAFINNHHVNFAVYCNPFWANRLSKRLALIGDWAESQGLEAAAKFHLARPHQVTNFIATPFSTRPTFAELKDACDKCDRLNPTQMKALLQRYQCEQPELRHLILEFLDTLNYRYPTDEYPLEEDSPQRIPFIIPDDGYSPDRLRYIPKGLIDYVTHLSSIRVGDGELCIFTLQPTSSGFWTVYFKNHQPDTPEMIVIQLRKHGPSMGLSIIATKGVGQDRQGIYIKSLIKGGAAAMDGRLQAGDQLLEVDGNSLLDISENQAAMLMKQTGAIVTLKVAKQAALYHQLWDEIQSAPTVPQLPPPKISPPQQVQAQIPPPPPQQQQHAIQQHRQPSPPRLPSPPRQQSPPVSMVKSPKKVSWLDNQPHQSLHTLIPPSPSLTNQNASPSPVPGDNNPSHPQSDLPLPPPPEMLLQVRNTTMTTTNDIPPFQRRPEQQAAINMNQQQHHQRPDMLLQRSDLPLQAPDKPLRQPEMMMQSGNAQHQNNNHRSHGMENFAHNNNDGATRGLLEDHDEEEEDEDEYDDNYDNNDNNHHDNNNKYNITSNVNIDNGNQITENTHKQQQDQNEQQQQTMTAANLSNGSQVTASESLTLEDIDEVLSSKTDTNWIEDSAGVIGTQEVYNDPRQRIVKEREHQKGPNGSVDVNHEELSFKEKLRIFNKKNEV